ncbi:MAG TPA: hypothetical protein VIV60_17940 [Polyangiaceae bacterium]
MLWGANIPTITRLYADPHQATAVIGPFGVVVWRGVTTPAAVARVRAAGVAALELSPGGIGMIGVVEQGAQVPDAECRRLSAQVNDELASMGVVGLAAVMPMSGFTGACMRGVVTGLNLLARNRYPFRAYESSAEACSWLSKLLSNSKTNWRATASVLDDFREEYRRIWSERPDAQPIVWTT